MKQNILGLFLMLLSSAAAAQPAFTFEHFNVTSVPIFNGNNFKAVAVGKFGKIWAGSQYHGIVKYDPVLNSWGTSLDLRNVMITDIKRGNDEEIWMAQAGQSGTQGGGSNIAGGVNKFLGYGSTLTTGFYSITAPGGLTSRNARSVWVDENHHGSDGKFRVWVAQGTYITSNTTTAGGISVGVNSTPNHFTKIYKGLQVTPNVPAAQAGLPNCIAVGGNNTEVWVCALANFGRSQILRYRADDPNTFIGFYDYTNTPALSLGFRANAIFFDTQGRGWLGLNEGGLRIKTSEGWKSFNDASVLPALTNINPNAITQDERGYIYFGTSAGVLIYKGGAVDAAASYQLVTVSDGLPTNTINDVAADTVNNRIVLAHTAGISFMKFNKKIDFSLEWDHSFPKINIKPVGVAADGASRLFVKVRRAQGISLKIKKIGLVVKSAAAQTSSLAGKVKKAIEIAQYSNEANSGAGAEAERTDSTANGDFYFWYVAPEDFSKDSLSSFAQLGERNDTVKIKVTYEDNSEDSTDMAIKVVRPPLILTSMAKKLAEDMKVLAASTQLLGDKIISKTTIAMNEHASLEENASRLIDGDEAQNDDVKHSYQGILTVLRKTGFASTRVDIIANDIAGVAVRVGQAVKASKFFADGDYTYNNYGKGFINKLITVNTPHNGSTLFQIIKDYGGSISEIGKKAIAAINDAESEAEPYELVTNDNGELKIAAAIVSKALLEAGSYKLPETLVKNHLIGTELSVAGTASQALADINKTARKVLDFVTLAARDVSPQLKPQIGASLGAAIGSEARLLTFIDNYSTSKGLPNAAVVGDLFSTIGSHLAGNLATSPHVSKQVGSIGQTLVGHLKTFGTVTVKIGNLLNTSINSPVFGNSIPANNISTTASQVANKIGRFLYDTAKIVITNREEISNAGQRIFNGSGIQQRANDTTVTLRYTVKDTVQLQYVFINYQDTIYTSTSRNRNQQISLTIKRNMLFSGKQEISAVAVYENADSIRYHSDTLNNWVSKPDTLKGFRITAEEADLFDGVAYGPAYEVKINNEWETLSAQDPDISFIIENPAKLAFNSTTKKFKATADGFSRIYFSYKTYKDTIAINCLLSLKEIAINKTIVNGSFKDSATWSKGRPPLPADSIIISTGHNIVLDSTVQIRSLKIETGASLTLNNSALSLQLGGNEDGEFMIDNYGSLIISNGMLKVNGRVKHNTGASFSMSGGSLVIDGNTGHTVTSLSNGLFLFEAATGMASFSFTGGTLQLIDPPIGLTSQAISCPYNFGPNSTLILGNGISTTAANNPNGFGGNGFPTQIGRLILDASTGSNRLLRITKPLTVKGSFEVRTGSNLQLQAPVTVSP